MMKTESREIGQRGYSYTVQQLAARQSARVFVRLTKLMGKPLADAIAAQGNFQDKDAAKLFTGFVEALSEEEFEKLCTVFAKCSTVSGGDSDQPSQLQYGPKAVSLKDTQIFDWHFAGSLGEMFGWLRFCLEVNYGSFLGEIRAVLAGVLAPPVSVLQTPPE